MNRITLNAPVHTLDMKQLLPEGSHLGGQAVQALAEMDSPQALRQVPLLEFGSIRDDILHYLSLHPYRNLYSESRQVQRLLNDMAAITLQQAILETIDYFRTRDPYTYRHILLVFALTRLLVDDLFADAHIHSQELIAGPLHDIGKICVPLHVLKKSQPLTRTERGLLEHHTLAGYALLIYYYRDTDNHAALVARDHHERNDRSGYPRGVPIKDQLTQIVAAADIYDALISPRPYRSHSYDNRTALEELTRMGERGALSMELVRALVAHNRKSKPHFTECVVSTEQRGTPPKNNLYGTILG